jgi:hypothetical protein
MANPKLGTSSSNKRKPHRNTRHTGESTKRAAKPCQRRRDRQQKETKARKSRDREKQGTQSPILVWIEKAQERIDENPTES